MWKGSFTLPQVPGFLSGTWPFPQSPLSLFSRSSLVSHHLLCMFLGENPWTGCNRGGDSSGFSLGLTLGHSGARHRGHRASWSAVSDRRMTDTSHLPNLTSLDQSSSPPAQPLPRRQTAFKMPCSSSDSTSSASTPENTEELDKDFKSLGRQIQQLRALQKSQTTLKGKRKMVSNNPSPSTPATHRIPGFFHRIGFGFREQLPSYLRLRGCRCLRCRRCDGDIRCGSEETAGRGRMGHCR